MRGPAQEGTFSFPVKYGYCAVGRVAEGDLAGREVFSLHPHQTEFRARPDALHLLPAKLPAKRAILGANMETALNILWDAGAGAGDKIVIVGTGVVGALTGYLASKLPGAEVTLMDINPDRAALADTLGCAFARPQDAPVDCDVAIHMSATPEGLNCAINCAGFEAKVVEASWYGSSTTPAALGGAFHSRRLKLISSQVGHVSATRRARWSYQRRMKKALELLCDPALDNMISGDIAFEDLPSRYGAILSDPGTLCHRVHYSQN